MPQQQTSQSSSGSSRKAGGGQKNNNNSSKNSKGRKSNNSSSTKIDENNRDDVDGQAQLSSNKQRQRQRKKNNGSEDNNNAAADNNEMKGSHTQTKKNTSKAKGPPRHNHNTANRNDEATTMVDTNDGKKQSTNRSNNKQSASSAQRQNQKSNGKKNGTTKKGDEKKSSSSNTSNSDNKNNTSGDNTTANKKKKRTSRTKKINYPPHAAHSSCLQRYNSSMSISSTTSSIISSTSTTTGKQIIRGKLRALPSSSNNNNNRGNANNKSKANAFVTCDRGLLVRDVVIQNDVDRNRALDGDFVFVELLDDDDGGEVVNNDEDQKQRSKDVTMGEFMDQLNLNDDEISDSCRAEMESDGDIQEEEEEGGRWHDDEVQMKLWDPVLNLRKKSKKQNSNVEGGDNISNEANGERQYSGRVICIVPTSGAGGQQASEFKPEDESYKKQIPKRTIVGTLSRLPDGNRYLLVPNNKCLPRFMCPAGTKEVEEEGKDDANADEIVEKSRMLYQAEYVFGSWSSMSKWPPCTNVRKLCGSCNVEDETKALLVENGVDHGDFPAAVLRDVDKAVKSGRFLENNKSSDGAVEKDMGWKPTEEMCRGRRDYRNHRIFTIDPTTAKDLDDALHVTPLPDGRVEIGVHIADVSHFIQSGSAVDQEALRRATTVYLVNDVIPMLPRPLCEIACSLNENVERLAFSVVWRMNLDGTLSKKGRKGKNKPKAEDEIWYGRTVIKSCARLDYATAQNIIDGKVATGEPQADETFWPKSRQPTGGHTIDQVAADVRLMHKVAMARRQLRFGNGALALNGIKLAFQLEDDGETPKLCAPYPIRDSNRLIEEYMLLANYFVAQRLITHAHGRALLRNHSPPIELGMQSVVDVSKEALNFDIDTTSSSTLQASLSRLSRECDDELVVQCITESLMTPMKPAEYIAAGELAEEDWHHFALNIPYYTHFTSPIRRYPDVIVHRLLQATIDDNVDEFPQNQGEIHSAAGHCNDKRMAAKKAQERSDRVFLSLYLKKNPITSTLGVCLSVGEKTFTVFVPKLGASIKVFVQEHEDCFETNAYTDDGGKRHIVISPKTDAVPGMQQSDDDTEPSWKSLNIGVFTKLEVACTCKARPPIDVRVKVVGPWKE